MTVVLVKRECPRHPGCYSLGECVVCATEKIRRDFDQRIAAILARGGVSPSGKARP